VRDEEAEGAPLPFQRPLAILIGPGSSSGAELCAGALQALGRATLIGEQTPGWLGSLTRVPLADGWTFSLCGVEALLGPDLWRRNRVGLAPDIPITPTADDEVAGRDPQLDVAIQLLSERAAGSVNS
jgi:C-terminal processing protease CtpA/Prc